MKSCSMYFVEMHDDMPELTKNYLEYLPVISKYIFFNLRQLRSKPIEGKLNIKRIMCPKNARHIWPFK